MKSLESVIKFKVIPVASSAQAIPATQTIEDIQHAQREQEKIR
jgi:hypothetical protein